MLSKVFGPLRYDYGWVGRYDYALFGKAFALRLAVACDEGQAIAPEQEAAFLEFEARWRGDADAIERALFDHYLTIVDERRAMAGPDAADAIAPRITTPGQLAALVEPTELVVQQAFTPGQRIVGLLFDCAWDPSLGLAIKFVNGAIDEVGPQDIVL